ncbi:MAG: septum formation initiator [Geobacteraceae bacterium GWC2_58_44]|nr:MAG: septum formation initiator [Geobacteraceae bacterium GWC2_58_44]HBG07364.1 septum formation initiator [Geobacter sp.]
MQKRLFLTPAAIIVFIMYFTVFGDRGLLRINHLHRDLDEMQARFLELKGENDKLKREIAALQSDRRYLESIARRDFGLVRSNEVIYQFPPQEKPPAARDKAVSARDQAEKKGDQKTEQKPGQPAAAVPSR